MTPILKLSQKQTHHVFFVVYTVPLLSSGPLTTMCASSSCSWACRASSLRLELRSCDSTCWAFLLSVVALRRFSAPSLIFSSLRISLRILSRCSSSRCCTLESEKSEFWSRPSCWSTDSPPGSAWTQRERRERRLWGGIASRKLGKQNTKFDFKEKKHNRLKVVDTQWEAAEGRWGYKKSAMCMNHTESCLNWETEQQTEDGKVWNSLLTTHQSSH